ncbi:MAG: type II secretion system F family protein [Thermoproteota archaeon]|nr:type II secretion system F family protein [Candidatus Brockarchaeota archaeon]MBO3768672.1 type II secretion system F family protein [Candidatus Brockarchaeota archaeon]MBO3801238.1 type II secretion system F family protein [Candidatus Brockarchaeota archaeon]
MALADVALELFEPFGKVLGKLVEKDLDAGLMRIYPPAYGAIVIFFTFVSAIISFLTWLVLAVLGLVHVFTLPLALLIPVAVFFLLFYYPKLRVTDKSSALENETPFAAAYVAVMSTGGISPYTSIARLGRFFLLPGLREFARILEVKVNGLGLDPVTAIEDVARSLPSQEFKELLLGYASTLRIGGDVVHYIMRRTELLFQRSLVTIKIIGERMGQIMEIYMVVAIIFSLGIYSIFTVGVSLSSLMPASAMGLFGSGAALFLFGYILMPMISVVFLWFIDLTQLKQPSQDYSPYIVYLATFVPTLVVFGTIFSLSFMVEPLGNIELIKTLRSPVVILCNYLNLPNGFESTVGLALTLIIGTIPAAIYQSYIDFLEGGIEYDMANFLRDLVEVRKSGLSPEKCIINLSERSYGKLSKHLKLMGRQLTWGVSFSKVYETFSKNIRNWFAKAMFFLLIDSIEVGGGMPETLETLASFNETMIQSEREKAESMKPLAIIPYIGSGTLMLVVVVLLAFFNSILSIAHSGIPYRDMVVALLPPIIVQSYLMGLVSGKVATTKTSQGFKHAIFLVIFSLIVMALVPYVNKAVAITSLSG